MTHFYWLCRLDEGFFAQLKFELGQLRFAVNKTEVTSVFSIFKNVWAVQNIIVSAYFTPIVLQHMEERQIELEALEKAIQEGIGL